MYLANKQRNSTYLFRRRTQIPNTIRTRPRRCLQILEQPSRLPLSLDPQLLKHETVPPRKTIRIPHRLKLTLTIHTFFKVALDLDVVLHTQTLLDAVNVQHDNSAESIVLCEPKRAEQIRRREHVVDEPYNRHSGIQARVDVGRGVVAGVGIRAPIGVRRHVS